MSTWIDFKALREKLDFAAVLKHYGVEVKLKGAQHMGYCPLPSHNGQRNSPSFSANVDKKCFQCFGCGAKGNVLTFAAYMEKLNPDDGRDLRKAGLVLQKQFLPEEKVSRTRNPKAGFKLEPDKRPPSPTSAETKPVLVNVPLDFELKDLNPDHPYLDSRNLSPETIKHFGLGFCSRGYLKGRIAIPLRDSESRLIGYAGRIVNETSISEETPKYLFPGTRERDGKIFQFRKANFLYNGYRFTTPVDDLIIVEGFFSVHWLFECGFENAVSLMGWACSLEQAKLVISTVKPDGRVWIFSDGDEAGYKCAMNVLEHVGSHRSVRWLRLRDGRQPTDCAKVEIQEMLLG